MTPYQVVVTPKFTDGTGAGVACKVIRLMRLYCAQRHRIKDRPGLPDLVVEWQSVGAGVSPVMVFRIESRYDGAVVRALSEVVLQAAQRQIVGDTGCDFELLVNTFRVSDIEVIGKCDGPSIKE